MNQCAPVGKCIKYSSVCIKCTAEKIKTIVWKKMNKGNTEKNTLDEIGEKGRRRR